MKRTTTIQLGFLHGLVIGVAGCGTSLPAPDPCDPALFQREACEQAVARSGHFYLGTWIPHAYPYPLSHYAGAHDRYLARGGQVLPMPAKAWRAEFRTTEERAAATIANGTAGGTVLSPSRMAAIATREPSLAASRRGATTSRGGFGAIGAGRGFRGA